MANYYNLDGIQTQLKKQLKEKKYFLDLWKSITFPTKKDGKPFANMQKNIDGATYKSISYAMQPGENEISVGGWCDGSGYINDSISCYCLVKYLKDEDKKTKLQNYMPKQTYLEQVYKYDLEDIKKTISERIEYLEKRVASLEKQVQISGNCYNSFKLAYSTAIEELKLDCSEADTIGFMDNVNDLFYAIVDTVKERYPYC